MIWFPHVFLRNMYSTQTHLEKGNQENDTFSTGSFWLLKHDRPTDFNVCIQGQIHAVRISPLLIYTYSAPLKALPVSNLRFSQVKKQQQIITFNVFFCHHYHRPIPLFHACVISHFSTNWQIMTLALC